MKIGEQIYQCTSKKLIDVFAAEMKEKRRIEKTWYAFAKKHGAESNAMVWHISDRKILSGLIFKQTPDPLLWKSSKSSDCWIPNRKARALVKEWDSIESYKVTRLIEVLKWNDIFHDFRCYGFNYFSNLKGFCGITVPIFDDESYENNPDLAYVPVKGLRPITAITYQRKFK